MALEPERGNGPHDNAVLRTRRADQERSAQEQKDQANVADEVLVEWTGCRDTGTAKYQPSGE